MILSANDLNSKEKKNRFEQSKKPRGNLFNTSQDPQWSVCQSNVVSQSNSDVLKNVSVSLLYLCVNTLKVQQDNTALTFWCVKGMIRNYGIIGSYAPAMRKE